MEEAQGLGLAIAQAVEKGQGLAAFGSSSSRFGVGCSRDVITVTQATLVAPGQVYDVLRWDVLAMVMVSSFEVESVVEDDFHAFSPFVAIAFGDAVEFADVVFIADAVVTVIEVEVGCPVVVDGGAGVTREDAQGGGALGTTLAVAEQEGQQGCAADMQPEASAREAEAGFVTAHGLGSPQTGGDGGDEGIEPARDALLAGADPTLTDTTTGEDLNDVGGAFQREEVADMQIDGESCQVWTVLGRLLGTWRRRCGRGRRAARADLVFHLVLSDHQRQLGQFEDLMRGDGNGGSRLQVMITGGAGGHGMDHGVVGSGNRLQPMAGMARLSASLSTALAPLAAWFGSRIGRWRRMRRPTVADRTATGGGSRRVTLTLDVQQALHHGLHAAVDQRRHIGTLGANLVEPAQPHNSRRNRATGISGSTRTCFTGTVIVRDRSSRVRPNVRPRSSQFAAV